MPIDNESAALFKRMAELLGTVELSWMFTERERIILGWHEIRDEVLQVIDRMGENTP